MKKRKLSRDQVRRATLGAQGFARKLPSKVDKRHFRRLFEDIGLLQLDSVNVLERSHYLPVFARLGGYDKSALHDYTVGSGEIFEYWGHAASLLPMELYPYYRFAMDGFRPWRRVEKLQDENPGYVEAVYQEIAENGPLTVSDLAQPGERKGSWWGWADGKTALEWLFGTGRITGYRAPNFGRVYDIPERVIPKKYLEAEPVALEDAYRHFLRLAVEHFAVGTLRDLADYYRLNIPKARPIVQDMVDSDELVEVEVEGWDAPGLADPDLEIPRKIEGSALLSPFDPVVWERDRALRIFDFHYRIEIYVPEPKRIFGYYVLPYLLDGELVGRVDLKADRKAKRLLVQAAHIEPGQDHGRVAAALRSDLQSMARWQGLDEVVPQGRGNLQL
ncbi:MAG: winged helix-turn-helix domain-containing protein [Acidimicrobiia bacterium]|nr:winged helix-turn-helix domain-containing protein [Acidimicrobiia bacterium]